MKKVLLASMIMATPVFAGGESTMQNPLASAKVDYDLVTVHDGTEQTRKTKDISIKGEVGEVAGGKLVIGYTKRDEDRKKTIPSANRILSGNEKANILSLKFTKVQPSWGFWGFGYAMGEGDVSVNFKLGNTLAKGTTTSDLSKYAVFAGTKVNYQGFEIIPMVQYSASNQKVKDADLKDGNTSSFKFDVASGKIKQLELSLFARKKIGAGKFTAGVSYIDNNGTNVEYGITDISTSTRGSIPDPTKRRHMAYSVAYELPVNDSVTAGVFYRQEKNGKTKNKNTYFFLGYNF